MGTGCTEGCPITRDIQGQAGPGSEGYKRAAFALGCSHSTVWNRDPQRYGHNAPESCQLPHADGEQPTGRNLLHPQSSEPAQSRSVVSGPRAAPGCALQGAQRGHQGDASRSRVPLSPQVWLGQEPPPSTAVPVFPSGKRHSCLGNRKLFSHS